MKRWMAAILAAALAVSLGGTGVFAHWGGHRGGCHSGAYCASCGEGHSNVDADGDGVCDHYAGSVCTGCGGGHSYADADGDGVCDHYAARPPRGGRHCGRWR